MKTLAKGGTLLMLACLALLFGAPAGAAVVQVSGGGLDVISAAVDGAAENDTIEITDSAVYQQDIVYWAIGKAIKIVATAGQTPSINFINASGSAIIPSIPGLVQFGSNDGGRITIRDSVDGDLLFNGHWAPDGANYVFENILFTNDGSGGTWAGGGGMFFYAAEAENISITFNNCEFTTSSTSVYYGSTYGSTFSIDCNAAGTMTFNVSDCKFVNNTNPIFIAGGNVTVENCLFQDWYGWGINCALGAYNLFSSTVHINNNAFYATRTSTFSDIGNTAGILFNSSYEDNIAYIDHCDFYCNVANVFMLGAIYSAGNFSDIAVTNCNIQLTGSSLLAPPAENIEGTPPTITYDYCNMNGAATGIWASGGHNLTTFVSPDYADLPADWTYTEPALLTADSAGGPIGSMLGGSAGGDTVPDVSGMTEEEATTALEDAGYVVEVEQESSDTVPEGGIIRTEPAAGEALAAGSTVTIVVSSGAVSDLPVAGLLGLALLGASCMGSAVALIRKRNVK